MEKGNLYLFLSRASHTNIDDETNKAIEDEFQRFYEEVVKLVVPYNRIIYFYRVLGDNEQAELARTNMNMKHMELFQITKSRLDEIVAQALGVL